VAGRRFLCATPRLGYTPVIQEIFATECGDLRQVPRDKINACEVNACEGLVETGESISRASTVHQDAEAANRFSLIFKALL
jgi:hypothetical protein